MPNHVHLLLHYAGGAQGTNTIIANGKRFAAYDIVKKLKAKAAVELLTHLSEEVRIKDREKGQKHVVWIDSFDVKECRTEKFVLQKLHYIHNNQVSGIWKLAATSLHYLYLLRRFILMAVKNCLTWLTTVSC
jgi:hypothetical protein